MRERIVKICSWAIQKENQILEPLFYPTHIQFSLIKKQLQWLPFKSLQVLFYEAKLHFQRGVMQYKNQW